MKIFKDIVQGSENWFRIKHGKIGGTRSGGLFIKSDTLLIEVLSEVVEDFEMDFDSYNSNDMNRGIELEPLAKQKLSEYTGITFNEVGWIQCEENILMGLSPDGLSECNKVACEIKCPAAKKHTQTVLNDCIPSDNLQQCIQYFTVNPELETLYFCSFRPENKYKDLFVKAITRETKIDIGKTKKEMVMSSKNGKGEKEYVETVPDIRTVQEWVNFAKKEADCLVIKIEDKLKQLSF